MIDGAVVTLILIIGISSMGVAAFFSIQSYFLVKASHSETLKNLERDLIIDIHKIGLSSLSETSAGRELLGYLSEEEKDKWNNPYLRESARENAKANEERERKRETNSINSTVFFQKKN